MSKEISEIETQHITRKTIVDKVIEYVCTPVYRPKRQWQITFMAVGWNRKTIEDFWTLFCRINKSRTGEITIFEFLNYFNLDRSEYVEKCFAYFDTTGGDSIDFLEFMISVWNICTMKANTLTSFTFDIYDLDSDGELSLPEIERMILELYGTNNVLTSVIGKEVMRDINKFAEDRGGVLSLTSFSIYTMNHSMLLFPIFRIQRIIQKKIMGIHYWKNVESNRELYFNSVESKQFDPRHVQILLRTYKTGAAAAILSHTGDPNVALKQQFEEDNQEKQTSQDGANGDQVKFKYEKLKKAVDKIKDANIARKVSKKGKTESIRMKTVDMAAKAFIEAGKKAKSSIANSKLGKIPSKVKEMTAELREHLTEPENHISTQEGRDNKAPSYNNSSLDSMNSLERTKLTTKARKDDDEFDNIIHSTTRQGKPHIRHKKKKIRPKSAPNDQQKDKRNELMNLNRSTKFDHRKSSFRKTIRPRTPGSIVYKVNEDGDFSKLDTASWFAHNKK